MRRGLSIIVLTALFTVVLGAAHAHASVRGRAGLHGIYLKPDGDDTETLGDENWGVGIAVVIVPPGLHNALAAGIGFEVVAFASRKVVLHDPDTMLRVEQRTSQTMFRLPIGARIGHQGHGFFRPYAGANFALNFFNIDTDVVVPDDSAVENEIRQDLSGDTETAAGFDIVLGTELNFHDKWYADMGVKFIRTFDAPQQLAGSLEKLDANYFQVFVGFGITFAQLAKMEDE